MAARTLFLCALVLVAVAATARGASPLNDRPVVGVLAQPTDGALTSFGDAYIAASYVKYLESAGARVAPIVYSATASELTALLDSINGVLFPGGGTDFYTTPQYNTTLQGIWSYVLQRNKAGDYFPLWGTCQGFEELTFLAAQQPGVVQYVFDSENLTLALDLTAAAASSRMFGAMPASVMQTLTDPANPVTMNNHIGGLEPTIYASTSALNTFYNVLSTNQDRKGQTFISSMEAFNFPVYGTQWHPEKNQFEWNPAEVINHSPQAMTAMQAMANFLVNETRKSTHAFSSYQDEVAALIYSYTPVYTEAAEPGFEQCYFFNI